MTQILETFAYIHVSSMFGLYIIQIKKKVCIKTDLVLIRNISLITFKRNACL